MMNRSEPDNKVQDRQLRAGKVNLATLIAALVLLFALILSILTIPGRPEPSVASGAPNQQRISPAEATEAILVSVQQHVRAGDHGQAAAILEEAVRSYADQQELRIALAETYVALNRSGDAYEQFIAALTIGPRDASIEFAAGTMARMNNRFDLALEHYSAAQNAEKSNPTYPLYLAQMQRKLDLTEDAKVSLLRVVALQPENAIAWGTLADIALAENKIDLALQHVARARELEPRVGAWRLIEARALKRQGKPEQALLVLDGLSDLDRQQLHNVRLIAECNAMLGKRQEAVACVVDASRARPGDADLALEAAIWLYNAGDKDAARTFATRAYTLGSDSASSLLEQIGE